MSCELLNSDVPKIIEFFCFTDTQRKAKHRKVSLASVNDDYDLGGSDNILNSYNDENKNSHNSENNENKINQINQEADIKLDENKEKKEKMENIKTEEIPDFQIKDISEGKIIFLFYRINKIDKFRKK